MHLDKVYLACAVKGIDSADILGEGAYLFIARVAHAAVVGAYAAVEFAVIHLAVRHAVILLNAVVDYSRGGYFAFFKLDIAKVIERIGGGGIHTVEYSAMLLIAGKIVRRGIVDNELLPRNAYNTLALPLINGRHRILSRL